MLTVKKSTSRVSLMLLICSDWMAGIRTLIDSMMLRRLTFGISVVCGRLMLVFGLERFPILRGHSMMPKPLKSR